MGITLSSRWAVPATLASLIIAADQASKAWIVYTLGPDTMSRFIPVLGDTARLAYSHNTGVAFSMFQGAPQLLTLTALVIVSGAIYFYATQLPNHRRLIQVILGLILGGAFGNIIDRIRLGYVVDFIQIGWFPIFNLADSAISVGAVLLMFVFVRDEILQQREQRALTSQ